MADKVNYSLLSTEVLIKKIALDSDKIALNHFLATRKLLSLEKKDFLLTDFLVKLRPNDFYPYISIYKRDKTTELKIELTYEKVLRKFSILKPQIKNKDDKGPYCNNQYKALYKKIVSVKEKKKIISSIKLEAEIAKIFKNMIAVHLNYSFLETLRDFSVFYRSSSKIKNETINIKKPLWIEKRGFKKWLEENITNKEGTIILTKEEIQKKIYEEFGYPQEISFDGDNCTIGELPGYDNPEIEIDRPKDFIHMIAAEKSSKINLLKPGIKKLGEEKIYRLVIRILESWINEEKKDSKIVREFGISKATYSRFAGRNWDRENPEKIPFLLKNIIGFFSKIPYFNELAAQKGHLETIKRILNIK